MQRIDDRRPVLSQALEDPPSVRLRLATWRQKPQAHTKQAGSRECQAGASTNRRSEYLPTYEGYTSTHDGNTSENVGVRITQYTNK